MATARQREGSAGRTHPGMALVVQQTLDPESALIAAMLRLVLTDACGSRDEWRQDAEAFLANGGVAWWDEALALGGVLVEMMQAALGQRGDPC